MPFWKDPLRNLSMVLLPAITVGYRYSAVTMRMTRSAMLEVMREDYIRTARAKGLLEQIVVNRHALKNALLPVVTLIGIEFAFLIGGLVVTEQVFNLNGIGRLFVQAVQNQDNVLAQALVMLVVLVFVVTNLVVDVLYAWLDPRIRYLVKGSDDRRHPHQQPLAAPIGRRVAPSPSARRCASLGSSAGASRSAPSAWCIVLVMFAAGMLRRLDRAVRSGGERLRRHDGGAELDCICSAPTSSAGTSSPAWCSARARR